MPLSVVVAIFTRLRLNTSVDHVERGRTSHSSCWMCYCTLINKFITPAETQDDWLVCHSCRPAGKSWHKNTSTRWWRTLLPARLWLPMVRSTISKSVTSSHHQHTGSFQSHQQTTGEDNARNANRRGSWLKQQNLVFFRFISISRDG